MVKRWNDIEMYVFQCMRVFISVCLFCVCMIQNRWIKNRIDLKKTKNETKNLVIRLLFELYMRARNKQ